MTYIMETEQFIGEMETIL